jgi:hypothetical protein
LFTKKKCRTWRSCFPIFLYMTWYQHLNCWTVFFNIKYREFSPKVVILY